MSSTSLTVRESGVAGVQRARAAAALAVPLLLVDGVIMLVAGDALSDHSRGPGLWSEFVVGLAFLAGAVALAGLTPTSGTLRRAWLLGPAGLAVAGLTMIGVVLTGSEPAEWLFALAVLPTFVGLVLDGIFGVRRGVWPWWTGAGVALFLPVMFIAPYNSFVMAAIWLAVACTARRPG